MPMIRIEHLKKRYRLGSLGPKRTTLREAIVDSFLRPWQRLRELSGTTTERDQFWALDDVSFDVAAGEAVGIIGRNGAGKSTLLKILSRITEPTAGRVELYGRVTSLLEVGTGFHSELTGRENIFLNGAILGMSRAEIKRKFDEIVSFAEVERFLDTQVKHYSSGMYTRLAFAVAAHLEPEILIVDEVLAVGDAAFQRKCLGKMDDVAKSGRTVLFVSHNMAAVTQLCTRVILLRQGQIEVDGPSSEISRYYLESTVQRDKSGERDLTAEKRSNGDGKVQFNYISLSNVAGQITSSFRFGEPIHIRLRYNSEISNNSGVFGICVRTLGEQILFTSASDDHQPTYQVRPGAYEVQVTITPNHLRPGTYWLQIGNTCGVTRDVIPDAIQFSIDDSSPYSETCIQGLPGVLHFAFPWSSPVAT